MKRTTTGLLLLGMLGLPLLVFGGTLEPGEVRTVEGKVSAVDLANRTVVLEVSTPKGGLIVGATMAESATLRKGVTATALDAVAVGAKAKLKYTRRDGQLVGLELQVKP